jgi:hypothetical protein
MAGDAGMVGIWSGLLIPVNLTQKLGRAEVSGFVLNVLLLQIHNSEMC